MNFYEQTFPQALLAGVATFQVWINTNEILYMTITDINEMSRFQYGYVMLLLMQLLC